MRTPLRSRPLSLVRLFALVLAALALVAVPGARAQQPAPSPPAVRLVVHVQHVPLIFAPAEQPLTVLALVEASHLAREIALYVRAAGGARYERLLFRRTTTDELQFSVVIPAELLSPGAVEYYIASRGADQAAGGAERLHFASPQRPQRVVVRGDAEGSRRQRLLALHHGNRSSLLASVEYVDFGRRGNQDGSVVSDSYWRASAQYSYRLLGWIDSIRVGAGLLLGQTYRESAGALLQIPHATRCNSAGAVPTDCRVGMYYGYAELRFRLASLVHLDLRPILGVGPQSFVGGAAGQLLIGHEPGSHVAVGVEGVSALGARGYLRLAWDTVPRLPMSFTVDVENFPNSARMAMRLLLRIEHRFSRHFSADLSAGYATRGWQVGGPSLGAGLSFDF